MVYLSVLLSREGVRKHGVVRFQYHFLVKGEENGGKKRQSKKQRLERTLSFEPEDCLGVHRGRRNLTVLTGLRRSSGNKMVDFVSYNGKASKT